MPGDRDIVTQQKLDAEIQKLLKRIRAGGDGGTGAENFLDLTDTPDTYAGAGGYVVKVNSGASGLEFVAGGAGVTDFIDLGDVPATYSGAGGMFVRVTDEEDGLEFAEVEDAPADRVIVEVTQASHGLSVGDAIKSTGADTYAKAQADTASNAEVIGVVSEVDGNDFKYIALGVYDYVAGVPVATVGTALFLSDATPGLLTATEPSTVGHVSKPVAVMVVSDSKMVIFPLRGVVIGSGGSAHADNFLDLTDTPNTYEGSAYGLVRVNEDEDGLEFSKPHESFANIPYLANFPDVDWVDGELDGQGVNAMLGEWGSVTATGIDVDTISSVKVINLTYANGSRYSKLGPFAEGHEIYDGTISFEFKTNIGDTSAGFINLGFQYAGVPVYLGIGGYSGQVYVGIIISTVFPDWITVTGDWLDGKLYWSFNCDSGAAWHTVKLSIRFPYLILSLDDMLISDTVQGMDIIGSGDFDVNDAYMDGIGIDNELDQGAPGEYVYIKNLGVRNNDFIWNVGEPLPAYV